MSQYDEVKNKLIEKNTNRKIIQFKCNSSENLISRILNSYQLIIVQIHILGITLNSKEIAIWFQ